MSTNAPPQLWYSPMEEYHQTSSNGLNGQLLLTAVLSLFFVVAFLIILHLYVHHVLRRRRRHLTTTTTTITTTSPNLLIINNSGLDPSVIATLPTFEFRRRTADLSAECSICLSAVEEGEVVRVLPKCKHVFHVGCIDMWLHSHSTCPVCRADVEPVVPKLEVGEGSGGAVMEVVAMGGLSGLKEEGTATASSRLGSSLRRMMSRDWSGRRVQGDGGVEDLERQ